MGNNVRQERASSEALRALSIIIKDKMNDVRLQNEFITLTYAKVSPDFRYCKVGFTVLNGNKNYIQRILQSSEGYIKKELLSMVKFPFAPKIDFIPDLGEDNSERVNEILKSLNIPKMEEETNEDLWKI